MKPSAASTDIFHRVNLLFCFQMILVRGHKPTPNCH